MNRNLLIKYITCLQETKKAVFSVNVVSREKELKFKITKESMKLQLIDRATSINELDLFVTDLESVLADVDYKVVSITESVYTLRNELYSSSFYNCIDYTQVYLPLFRILGDQVVFLAKSNTGKLEKMFFINGRVFTFSEVEDSFEVNQTDLRKVSNYTIVNFEKLGRRYSYNTVFKLAEDYSNKKGLRMSVKKFGMSCQ